MITAEQANNLRQATTLEVVERNIMQACSLGGNYIVATLLDSDVNKLKELGYEIGWHPGRHKGDIDKYYIISW